MIFNLTDILNLICVFVSPHILGLCANKNTGEFTNTQKTPSKKNFLTIRPCICVRIHFRAKEITAYMLQACSVTKKTARRRYDFKVQFHGGSSNRTKKSPSCQKGKKRGVCVVCACTEPKSQGLCAHRKRFVCMQKKGNACMPLPPIHLPPWLSTVILCIQSMACRHEEDNYQEEAIAAVYVGFCWWWFGGSCAP